MWVDSRQYIVSCLSESEEVFAKCLTVPRELTTYSYLSSRGQYKHRISIMKTRRLVLFLLAFTIANTWGAAILEEPVEYIMIEDPSLVNGQIPEYIDGVIRIKRSGSGDFFGYIKKGITSKIAQIAQASAGSSAHFSKSSSSGSSGGGGGGGYHYGHPHDIPSSYDNKSFDFWGLKKSIFNTLIQAVKAIKGGVIAIKGQLIKGGGALVSAKGNIISMKGEAISNLGRHIINSAHLSPSAHSSHHMEEYSAPSAPSGPEISVHPSTSYGPPKTEYGSHSGPSGPAGGFPDHPPSSGYGAPSNSYGAPSSSYGAPSDFYGPPPPSAPSKPYLPQKLNTAYAETFPEYHDGHF
ncbi:uncharacterized protein CBL_04596 [Carabus blaptoides fortunei]